MGCGKGYWAHLVQQRGGYVTPFDITVPADGEAWTKVTTTCLLLSGDDVISGVLI